MSAYATDFLDTMRERAESIAAGLEPPRSWAPTSWLVACHRRSPEADSPAHLVELAERELTDFVPPDAEWFGGRPRSRRRNDELRRALLADAEEARAWLDRQPFEALRAAHAAWAVRRAERSLIEHVRAERKS